MEKILINFIIKLKNAVQCKKPFFFENNISKKIIKILKILKNSGYIRTFYFFSKNGNTQIKIILKYQSNNQPIFSNITFLSKPGFLNYKTYNQLIRIKEMSNLYILSTSKGYMTKNDALKQNIGGIILLKFQN